MSVNLFTPHCCRIVAHKDDENNSQSLKGHGILSDIVPSDIVPSHSVMKMGSEEFPQNLGKSEERCGKENLLAKASYEYLFNI
jgi:hypothetical protein